MIGTKEIVNSKKSNNLTDIEVEYFKENKDENFRNFTNSIDLKDEYLMNPKIVKNVKD